MKFAGPSALGRAGIAAALGIAAPFLVPIACGVDAQPPPAPHVTSGTSAASTGSAGSAGGSSTSTTSTSGGPGPANVCECAAAAFAPDSICADCFHQVSGVDCADSVTTCQKDQACVDLIVALAGCDAGTKCIAATLASHPGRNAYLDVLGCVCASCATSCALTVAVECDAGKTPVEAGSDSGLDGGGEAGSDGGDAGDSAADASDDVMDADGASDAADSGG